MFRYEHPVKTMERTLSKGSSENFHRAVSEVGGIIA